MNLGSFDLNLLKVLDALLVEESTTRAAARIGLSQPAVSAALARLRAALDDPLFIRDGQALRPTDFARSLRDPIRAHLNGLEQTLAGMGAFDPSTCDRSFRISGSDYFSVLLLPALMHRLSEEAPGIRISFVDMIQPSNLHDLGRFDIDMALPCAREISTKVVAQPLFWSSWQVVARHDNSRLARANIGPGDDIPLDLFCDMDHVAFTSDGQHFGYEDHALAERGRSRRLKLTVGSFRDLYETVAGSDLLATLPRSLALAVADRFSLSLHPLPFALEPALLWLAWNRWQTEDPAHRWLRDLICDLLRDVDPMDRPLPNPVGLSPGLSTAAE